MKFVPNAVTLKVARTALVLQKNAPNALFGVGVVGVVATAVLASRATLKVDDVLVEHEVKAKMINDSQALRDEKGNNVYSEEDAQKDKVLLFLQSGGKIVKLYAPAIVTGVVTIACLTKSHNMLNERNAGLAAAYAIVDKAFGEYRKRVEKELGPEKDLEFRHGWEERETLEETKQGPKVTVAKKAPQGQHSMYARFFDESNPNYQRASDYNFVFLRAQQTYMNDLLHSRGHLFLNEVYDALGINRTSAGQVVGWVLGNGDDFVDFGFWDDRPAARDFVAGRENSVLLDFNVDGPVYELLDKI